ncbi:MAG: uncharacterized protein JWQ04_2235 [Pedosphaera sp.]|nr:uncharacterized protein [Pedosphaera sp.]
MEALNEEAASALQYTRQVPRCAFTIDVEDWYQSSVDFDAAITERVPRNVDRVLRVLDDCRVKASFFVQGRVAETFPEMLQTLLAEGHEIQSHGYSHRPLFGMNRRELRTELERARKSVEDACGVRVTAFRAPDFSIVPKNLWALESLAECGFTVDSSIFPMRMKRYGIAGWETLPRQMRLDNGGMIWEAPVAVWNWRGWRAPVAGGGYFRLLPHVILRWAVRSMLAQRRPVIIYCHPYEFNERELDDYRGKVSRRFRFTQSLGRASFVMRVRRLLAEFPFGRFDEVLAAHGVG